MIRYKPGDVVLLLFPFTDFSTIKQRPAVVVSSAHFNKTHEDVIIAAITSHIPDRIFKTDYRISKNDQTSAGLPQPSLVKLSKIITIDQRLIRKKIGSISKETITKVLKLIQGVFVL